MILRAQRAVSLLVGLGVVAAVVVLPQVCPQDGPLVRTLERHEATLLDLRLGLLPALRPSDRVAVVLVPGAKPVAMARQAAQRGRRAAQMVALVKGLRKLRARAVGFAMPLHPPGSTTDLSTARSAYSRFESLFPDAAPCRLEGGSCVGSRDDQAGDDRDDRSSDDDEGELRLRKLGLYLAAAARYRVKPGPLAAALGNRVGFVTTCAVRWLAPGVSEGPASSPLVGATLSLIRARPRAVLPAPAIRGAPIVRGLAAAGPSFRPSAVRTIPPQRSGLVQTVPLFVRQGLRVYPSLALSMLARELGARPVRVVGPGGHEAVEIGSRRIAVDALGRARLRTPGTGLRGGRQSFATVAAADVIKGARSAALLKGRLVLVGTGTSPAGLTAGTSAGSDGRWRSEVFRNAAVLSGLVRGTVLSRPWWAGYVEAAALVGLGVLLVVLTSYSSAWVGLLFGASLIAGVALTDLILAVPRGILIGTDRVVLGLLLILGCALVVRTIAGFASQGRLKHLLGGRLSKRELATVLSGKAFDPGRPTRTKATCVSIGLRGLGAAADSLDAAQAGEAARAVLATIGDWLTSAGGLLLSASGNRINAVFLASLGGEEHARRATLSTLRVVEGAAELLEHVPLLGPGSLSLTAAVDGGEVVLFTPGVGQPAELQAIGDAVELVSALESSNAQYGTRILATGSVRRQLSGELSWREVDLVRIGGRSQPIDVHELLQVGDPPEQTRRILGLYGQALAAFRSGRFDAAEDLFGRVVKERPEDGPARELLRRSREERASLTPQG